MDNNTRNILFGTAAVLLPFLFKKDKTQSSSTPGDLSRFENYPTKDGELGGGFYDKLTQERLQEQAKKDSSLYFGDKSKNSIYDPFYDYNDSPIQANGVTARDLSATDYETATKCIRVRLVPNSIYVSNVFTRHNELRENHIYACVVEIFNPFQFDGLDSLKFKVDIDNITLSENNMYVYDGNFNRRKLSYHNDLQSDKIFIDQGIDTGIYRYFKHYESNEGAYANLPTSLPGMTSVFIPVFLSYLPNAQGNVTNYWYMDDNTPFYTYDSKHKEITGRIANPISGIEFAVLLKVNDRMREHTVSANTKDNSYSFTAEKSVSNSHQNKEFFALDSTPIYQRPEFWSAILKQRQKDLSDSGGAAARSYWWNYTRLRNMEKFAPFGAVDINI